MPSRPYAQSTSPEQSNPPAGEAPPHRYGTPTALTAIAAARSPTVGTRTACFGSRHVGFGRSTAAAAFSDPPGSSALTPPGRATGPAPAQQKTIAANADPSSGLWRGFGKGREDGPQ